MAWGWDPGQRMERRQAAHQRHRSRQAQRPRPARRGREPSLPCSSVGVGRPGSSRTAGGCPPASRRPRGRPDIEPWSKPASAGCDNAWNPSGTHNWPVNGYAGGLRGGISRSGGANRREKGSPGSVGRRPRGRASSPAGPYTTPGDGTGCFELTERLPGELEEGLARGRIGRPEVGDIGEQDAHRIAAIDVTRPPARGKDRVGEDDGIPGAKGWPGGHRQDRVAAPTALDLRDPLFVSGVDVHGGARHRDGISIDASDIARAAHRCPARGDGRAADRAVTPGLARPEWGLPTFIGFGGSAGECPRWRCSRRGFPRSSPHRREREITASIRPESAAPAGDQ